MHLIKKAVFILLACAGLVFTALNVVKVRSVSQESSIRSFAIESPISDNLRPICSVNYTIDPVFDFRGFDTWLPDQLIATWDAEKISPNTKPTFTLYSITDPSNMKGLKIDGRAFGWSHKTGEFYYSDAGGNLFSIAPHRLSKTNRKVYSVKRIKSAKFKRLLEHQVALQSSHGFALFKDNKKNTISALNLATQELLTISANEVTSFGVKCNNFENDECALYAVNVKHLDIESKLLNFYLVYTTKEGIERSIFLGNNSPSVISISGDLIHFAARGEGYKSLWMASKNVLMKNLTPNLTTDFSSGHYVGSGGFMLTDFFGQSQLVSVNRDGSQVLASPRDSQNTAQQFTYLAGAGDLGYLRRSRMPGHQDQVELVRPLQQAQNLLTCAPGAASRGIEVTARRDNRLSNGFWFPPKTIRFQTGQSSTLTPETFLYFHGGPAVAEDGWGNLMIEKLTGMGIGVIVVNYPLTPGYGDAYIRLGQMGPNVQAQSGLDLLEEVSRIHNRDLGRIYLLGVSYGGVPVSSLLRSTEDQFGGAMFQASVCNLNSDFVGLNGPYPPFSRSEFGLQEQNQFLVAPKTSAMTSVDYNGCNMQAVNAPVFAVAGALDRPNIKADTERMAKTAKSGKVVIVPNQGHSLQPETITAVMDSAISWFREKGSSSSNKR